MGVQKPACMETVCTGVDAARTLHSSFPGTPLHPHPQVRMSAQMRELTALRELSIVADRVSGQDHLPLNVTRLTWAEASLVMYLPRQVRLSEHCLGCAAVLLPGSRAKWQAGLHVFLLACLLVTCAEGCCPVASSRNQPPLQVRQNLDIHSCLPQTTPGLGSTASPSPPASLPSLTADGGTQPAAL